MAVNGNPVVVILTGHLSRGEIELLDRLHDLPRQKVGKAETYQYSEQAKHDDGAPARGQSLRGIFERSENPHLSDGSVFNILEFGPQRSIFHHAIANVRKFG